MYEATAPAVPFLADAALGDVVGRDDRIWLVLLLAWIADGTSYLDVHLVVAETDDLRRLVLQLALGTVGGHLDVDDALRRLPDEYYGDEDIVELRERFRSESETVVFRDIVDNISGAAITFDD